VFYIFCIFFLTDYMFSIIMAAVNNRSFSLNFSFLFAVVFMTALATARPIAEEHPCDEIYIVGEGETLQTISEKCNAPFILIDNPHIQDTDDVYEGVPLKITHEKTEEEIRDSAARENRRVAWLSDALKFD